MPAVFLCAKELFFEENRRVSYERKAVDRVSCVKYNGRKWLLLLGGWFILPVCQGQHMEICLPMQG